MLIKQRVQEKGSMLVKTETVFFNDDDGAKGKKAIKLEEQQNLKVTVNGIEYDADIRARNNMSNAVSVANAKFNMAVATGTSLADAYDAVYEATIPWKGADNATHNVKVKSIVAALELAMARVGSIVGVM